MAVVKITEQLFKEIVRTFSKKEAEKVIDKLESLEQQPNKGKTVGNVANIVVKELKYKKYRFYYVTDGRILKFGTDDDIAELLIKFVNMSEKKDQEERIEEILKILKELGFQGM